ncbi:hypothetical protein [Ammoniphilus sp. CFH 90114]|uniref:hypothetical protein n=1 Tax=Ammoniphilus sp. CFH 90114 TaxID=2493665 RepID=UPI00101003F6|nr:hypothetical protein [Ammoniphilus sp. CFH 90114]RXT06498.1 hypothetical protein EIZ39_15645 [Ammoniphilus sp. CFH 90114]
MHRRWLYIVTTLMVGSLFLNGYLYLENRSYERYLADHIANKVSPLSSSILKSKIILEDVLEKKSISYEQAEEINYCLRHIAVESQDLLYLGGTLNSFSPQLSNKVSLEAVRDKVFFEGIVRDHAVGDIILLDYTQLEDLHRLHNRINRYALTVGKHVIGATPEGMDEQYWNRYLKSGTIHPYWKNLMVDLEWEAYQR